MLEHWLRILLALLIGGFLLLVGIDYVFYSFAEGWKTTRLGGLVGRALRTIYGVGLALQPSAQLTKFNRIGFGLTAIFVGAGFAFVGIANALIGNGEQPIVKPGYQGSAASLLGNPTMVGVSIVVGFLLGLGSTRHCRIVYRVLASIIATAFTFSAIASATYHVGKNAQEWFVAGSVLAVIWAILMRFARDTKQDSKQGRTPTG